MYIILNVQIILKRYAGYRSSRTTFQYEKEKNKILAASKVNASQMQDKSTYI